MPCAPLRWGGPLGDRRKRWLRSGRWPTRFGRAHRRCAAGPPRGMWGRDAACASSRMRIGVHLGDAMMRHRRHHRPQLPDCSLCLLPRQPAQPQTALRRLAALRPAGSSHGRPRQQSCPVSQRPSAATVLGRTQCDCCAHATAHTATAHTRPSPGEAAQKANPNPIPYPTPNPSPDPDPTPNQVEPAGPKGRPWQRTLWALLDDPESSKSAKHVSAVMMS